MRKGMVASFALAMMLTIVPAAFADQCPCVVNFQGPGDEFQVFSGRGAYLGVEVSDVTPERMAALKLKEESGVEVTAVDQDAPAGKAGVKEHDVILTINGQKMESEEQLRRVIRETPPGRTITLGISRDGQPVTLKATLGNRKTTGVFVGKVNPKVHVTVPPVPPMPPESFHFEMPDVPEMVMINRTSRIGAMVENLTPQLADFFGVKDGTGLLVRSVEKGSAAEAAGLRAGDVIVRLDKERINDVAEWRRLMRAKSGNVGVGIVRDKREQSLTVKVPERKEQGELRDGLDLDLDLDFDYSFDTEAFQKQMKELGPKIEEQQRIAQLQVEKEFKAHRADFEKAQKEAMKEHQKEMEKVQKDLKKVQEELQKQLKTISYE